MLSQLRMKLAAFINRFKRRHGPSLADICVHVIMRMCALQLPKDSSRKLAPAVGMVGPCYISGGSITKLVYQVFDRNADKIDASTRLEPWRAFQNVTLLIYVDRNPEWKVEQKTKDGEFIEIPVKDLHKTPGLTLIAHLAQYFPLLPDPYTGQVYAPQVQSL